MDNLLNSPIDINKYHQAINKPYANHILSTVNDHVVRVSIMTEDFYWHCHPNSDEVFIVVEGVLLLDLESQTIEINRGQMFTVPANTRHRTRPKGSRSVNLTIERANIETEKI